MHGQSDYAARKKITSQLIQKSATQSRKIKNNSIQIDRNSQTQPIKIGHLGGAASTSVHSNFEERFSSQRKRIGRAQSLNILNQQNRFKQSIQLSRCQNKVEIERIEKEDIERKKQIQMSRNLIDILFQTEKDVQKQKFKREKERLRQLALKNDKRAVNPTKRGGGGSRATSSNAKSNRGDGWT